MIKVFYLTLLTSLLIISLAIGFEYQRVGLEFIVFDIGQGDSILIRTPKAHNILVDGSNDNSVLYKLGKYLPFWQKEIDLIIITHPHTDHFVGLFEVVKRYRVKNILLPRVLEYSFIYSEFLELVKSKDINLMFADRIGDVFLDKDVVLKILHPVSQNFQDKNLNNYSIVSKLIYKDFSILLTGDFENEESLIGLFDLEADILKVGHHGSSNANDFGFLKAISPKISVISCGLDNKFNHPSQSVLNDLHKINSDVHRTDLQGDFYYLTTGQEVW